MDPITDIFKTMRVAGFVHSRVEATAPWGLMHQATEMGYAEMARHLPMKAPVQHFAHFGTISRGSCWLMGDGIPEPIPLTGGDCFLIAPGISYSLRDTPDTPAKSFCSAASSNGANLIEYGGGGELTTIICGLLRFETLSLKAVAQLLPPLILIRAGQAQTAALHTTLEMLAAETAEPAPGSEAVTNRLAEILFIQTIRAYFASGAGSCKPAWLRAVFDPQIGAALKSIHENVKEAWTVESLAESAGMSRSAFAARFKELLGQTPLEYVTQWRMQKAVQLLGSDQKLINVAQSIGYESDAAFSKAFKRILGMTPGEFRRNGGEFHELSAN